MRRLRVLVALAFVLLSVAALAPASVSAADSARTTHRVISPKQALTLALRQPAFRAELRRHPHAETGVSARQDANGDVFWSVTIARDTKALWAVEVDVTPTGQVKQVWTGVAAGAQFARGPFDPLFSKPWVWLTFGVLFLVPFVDPRRLRRLLHLDLAVMASFGVSFAFLHANHAEAAIWAVYPPLAYLLVRMLAAGRARARRPGGRLVPLLPTAVLLVGVIGLFGARVALNVADPQVIDIGYMSVVGADRINHGEPLYVDNSSHGDTYGPVNYIAYIPFVATLGFSGEWDRLPAAHGAAIFFDLMTLLGLFVFGLRLRAGPEGRRLGLALAWAWAAFPFTLLTLMQSSNDGLVAMLLVWSLVAFASPWGRGALLGFAVAAKFSPGGLLLLFARGRREDGARDWVRTSVACLGLFAFAMAVYWPAGGLRELWSCTMGYQLSRPPDFSLWAIYHGIGWTQTALEVLAVGLAAAVAVIPSRRGVTEVAALAAAVLIALQLPGGHWFYFYTAWFAPLVFVALFTAYRDRPAVAAAYDGESAGASPDAVSPDSARLAA